MMNCIFKKFVGLLGFFLIFSGLGINSLAANDNAQMNNQVQACTLKVGWGIWPPYQYLSEEGKAKGLQIELLNQIANEAGCQLDYIQQPFSQNLSDLESGRIDMMADTTITESRQQFAYFSDAYRSEILILYVKAELLDRCKGESLAELLKDGFKLGLTKGNIYGEQVEVLQTDKQFAKNIVYLAENQDGIHALLDEQIDGYFEDPTVQAYELKRNQLRGKIVSCKIEIYAGKVSLMFSKKTVDPKTVEKMNSALIKIKQTESYRNTWEW